MLLPLARFFSLYSSAQPRSRELLVRWLWRGAVSGAHQTITFARSALSTMSEAQPEELVVQALLAQLPPATTADGGARLSLRNINPRAATTKILANVLASLRPVDLTTGRELDLTALFGTDRPYLQALVVGAQNDLANRLLHPPFETDRPLASLIRMKGDPVLPGHAISDAALAALRGGAVDEFFRLREETLRDEVDRFVRARTHREDSDRPSLRWLTAEEEE